MQVVEQGGQRPVQRGAQVLTDGALARTLGSAGRQRLHDALPGPKRFVTIPGGDHNDAAPADPALYWSAVRDFVATHSRRHIPTSRNRAAVPGPTTSPVNANSADSTRAFNRAK